MKINLKLKDYSTNRTKNNKIIFFLVKQFIIIFKNNFIIKINL